MLPKCTILFLMMPYVLAKNSTHEIIGGNHNIKPNETDNISKLFNEAGAAVPEDPSLSKGNDLLSLSRETGKMKKVSSVVRKNGVQFPKDHQITNNLNSNITASKETSENNKAIINNITSKAPADTNEAHKKVAHKPLVLSYESLSKMGISHSGQSFPKILSSTKTFPDQVQPPADSKFYSINAVKHPGMIMPIVITILVVPMFAVLGYMAVKRGKEAWKNRHYKRMDFLLDGMYND